MAYVITFAVIFGLIGAVVGRFIGGCVTFIVFGIIYGIVMTLFPYLDSDNRETADARARVEVRFETRQLNRWSHDIDYQIHNRSKRTVRGLSFDCDGVRSRPASIRLEPGETDEGTVRVPFTERLGECKPIFGI